MVELEQIVQVRKTVSKLVPLYSWLHIAGLLAGIIALIAEYGFKIQPGLRMFMHIVQVIAVIGLWTGRVSQWRKQWTSKPSGKVYYRFLLDVILLAGLAGSLLLLPSYIKGFGSLAQQRWTLFHVYLLVLILLYLGRFILTATAAGRNPTQILVLSFTVIILTGSLLLMLPSAHRLDDLSFTNAVFTATSATCVTGLIVQDTGGDFTRFGQSVILVLMQVGGLGIMIFGSLFALLLGSPLSLRESVAVGDILNEQSAERIGRMVIFICITTFCLEAVGAIGLSGMWQMDSAGAAAASLRGGDWFQSIFHSVSAFCNAGFSLHDQNLADYRFRWQSYGIVMVLIVLGGLGFPVLKNIWSVMGYQFRKRVGIQSAQRAKSLPVVLTLHSKIVLITTAFLIIGGAVTLFLLEKIRPDAQGQTSWPVLMLDCLFNSVTARTAGFNTVQIDQLSAGSKLVLIFLMCIGGSPSSTAGGIKTVTFAVMAIATYTTIRRRYQIHIFRRSVPVMIIHRVSTLIILYGMILWIATLLLTLTEHSLGANMLDLLFEASSALGTVGLSTGVTGHLTLAGKWVIIMTMLIGRLGPLSFLAALTFNTQPVRYDYPREPLVIG